jgi:hypothetical protein
MLSTVNASGISLVNGGQRERVTFVPTVYCIPISLGDTAQEIMLLARWVTYVAERIKLVAQEVMPLTPR